jgi:tRNA uridine 5-carboxymethylaminomethyl modification enzyme
MPTSGSEKLGCVGPVRRTAFAAKMDAIGQARSLAAGLSMTPTQAAAAGLRVNQDGQRRDALQLLAYPSISFEDLVGVWPQLASLPVFAREQLEIDALYSGYLDRQDADVAAFRRDEDLRLPVDLDYAAVGGLSAEARQKLSATRPTTLGQAGRIEGMTPSALTALLAHVRKRA